MESRGFCQRGARIAPENFYILIDPKSRGWGRDITDNKTSAFIVEGCGYTPLCKFFNNPHKFKICLAVDGCKWWLLRGWINPLNLARGLNPIAIPFCTPMIQTQLKKLYLRVHIPNPDLINNFFYGSLISLIEYINKL